MYFCLDDKARKIVDENGVRFTLEQFAKIVERYDRLRKPLDMTLSCQRLMRMGGNWDALEEFYAEN